MKRWTDSEIEVLYYNKHKPTKVIHRDNLPNRSLRSIDYKRNQLSLYKSIRWDKEEFIREDAKMFYEKGYNDVEVEERLLVTKGALRTFKHKYGYANKDYLWKKEEVEILKKGLQDNLTYEQIKENLPLRTIRGVIDKIRWLKKNAQ